MGIPEYIKQVAQTVRNDEQISRKRSSYVEKFCALLKTRARTLRLKDSHLPVIGRMYEFGMQQLEDRILMTCVRSQSETLKPHEVEHNIRLTEFDFMSKFKEELETEESPDYDDQVYGRNAAKGPHPIHRVLSLHNDELTQALDTVGTTVLDELAKHDVITDSDEEVITSGQSRQDRNRHLIAVLSTSPPEKDMGCFVDFLQDNHGRLGNKIAETVRQYAREPPDKICAACTVFTMVDPGRIAKVMYERRHIPGNFYKDLVNPHISTEKKWKLLRKKGLEEEAILALRPKYHHFYLMFSGQRDLTCTCKDSDIDLPLPIVNGTSSKNSGPSSFKRWSAKNPGTEVMETVLTEVRQMRSSFEDLRQKVEYQPLREPLSRPASMTDVMWPPHSRGSFSRPVAYTDFGSRYSLRTDLSAVDTRVKPKESKSIFKKIRKKFSSKDGRH